MRDLRDRVLYGLFFAGIVGVGIVVFLIALLIDCGLSVWRRVVA